MQSILFYAPFNQRSRDTESLMIAFRRQGHRVMLLTQQEGHQIKEALQSHDIAVYTHVIKGARSGWWYFLRHTFFFISFCRKHKIDIVYSHLEPANLVASIGQYFISSRTYLCRHYTDEGRIQGFSGRFHSRLIYRIAKKIIVVSEEARTYLIGHEGIPASKVMHINLAYDFALYERPDTGRVRNIRTELTTGLMLIDACRMIRSKRPGITVHILKKLKDLGLDAKLVILGAGELTDEIRSLIAELGLEKEVVMPGYVDNVLEYLAAADFLVHPSTAESSCVVVKESGLVRLPVVVCKDVGDFNDYIDPGKNGFLVSREKFIDEAVSVILNNMADKARLREIGENLRKTILERFDVNAVIGQYDSLNSN